MFLLKKPAEGSIIQFLESRKTDHFSYRETGATKTGHAPAGYNVDHNRVQLGTGSEVFENAKIAIRSWEMFGMDWVTLVPDRSSIEVGIDAAIVVEHFGFYSLNAARVVYLIDGPARFGFAYGTLTEHGEIGEERFSVELDPASGEVSYDLFAFSRPASILAIIGYPLSRRLQKAFARDSKNAMKKAVSNLTDLSTKRPIS